MRRGSVGKNRSSGNNIALCNQDLLVDAGSLVRAVELTKFEDFLSPRVVGHGNRVAVYLRDCSVLFGNAEFACIMCSASLNAGTHVRGLRANSRDCLTLHVGTHKCAVCIVVLKERNQRCSNRDNLLRRDVHVVKICWAHERNLTATLTSKYTLIKETVVVSKLCVCLCDDVLVFIIRG